LVPDGTTADTRIEYELGQSMFTPEDITRTIPDPNDRPYAALAYGSFGIVNRRSDQWLDQYQVVFGIVGPSARGKELQRWVHAQINAREPRGWDTQIRDQFAGEVRFQRSKTLDAWHSDTELYGAELTPHFGASVGNLTTSANVGLGFRFGRRLPADFGPPRISPSLPGSGYFEPQGGFGWYLFGGIDVRYMAHSLVLDASSRLGQNVERRPWVADLQGGAALYWNTWRIAYTQVWRTREFEAQGDRFSSFGAVSLTWRY
jgi:lipid A 3-O-deacylase